MHTHVMKQRKCKKNQKANEKIISCMLLNEKQRIPMPYILTLYTTLQADGYAVKELIKIAQILYRSVLRPPHACMHA